MRAPLGAILGGWLLMASCGDGFGGLIRASQAAPPRPGTPTNPPRVVHYRDREAQLEAVHEGDRLRLVLTNPRFYDLDASRLRTPEGAWDRLEDGGPNPESGPRHFGRLIHEYASYLEKPEHIAFCWSAEGDDCGPCSNCSVRLIDILGSQTPQGTDPMTGAVVRLDRVRTRPRRGDLCDIVDAQPPGSTVQPPTVEYFAPRVALSFEVTGFDSMLGNRPFVRVAFPGWAEPFVAERYGLEVRRPGSDGRPIGVCRSIRPMRMLHGPLATHVVGSLQGRGRVRGAARRAQPSAVARHMSDAVRPFHPDRDRTEFELLAWSGRAMTFSITEPKVLNLDGTALEPDAPGHGWDLWDPEGWSQERCGRYRSLQCLMLEYAEYLGGHGQLSVTDADGGTHVCASGCRVRLLEVLPAPEVNTPFSKRDVVRGMIVAASLPRGQSCADCLSAVETRGVVGPSVQFASPNVRVVFEVHFPVPLPSMPRSIALRFPGADGPGNWFAGVDVGLPLIDKSGRRFGRARSFCPSSVVQAVVTSALAPSEG